MNIDKIQELIAYISNNQQTNPSGSNTAEIESFLTQFQDALKKLENSNKLPSGLDEISQLGTELSKIQDVETDEEDEVKEESIVAQGHLFRDDLLTNETSSLTNEKTDELVEASSKGLELETVPLIPELEEKLTQLKEQLGALEAVEMLEGVDGFELPELVEGMLPELKWETKTSDDSEMISNDLKDSLMSGGWSSQNLSKQAEELGVKAPEGGFNERINALLNQTSIAQNPITPLTTGAEVAQPTEVAWSQREQLMSQIMDHVSTMHHGSSSKLSLTLVPKHLGTMQLEFEMVQGQLRGRIITQSKEVGHWMEKAIQSLSNETVSLKAVQVETQNSTTDSFFFSQQHSSGQHQSEAKTKASIWGQGRFLMEEDESMITSNVIDEDVRLIF